MLYVDTDLIINRYLNNNMFIYSIMKVIYYIIYCIIHNNIIMSYFYNGIYIYQYRNITSSWVNIKNYDNVYS